MRPFTRHDIDAVIPDKPVVLLSFCGHLAMLNTKALEAAGVTRDTDDLNGLIVREADGSPSGYISEPVAFRPIIFRIPGYEFTPQEHHECQKKAFAMMNEMGFTLMCDCQQAEAAYTVLSEMAKNGEFSARVSGVHNVNDATREEDMEKALANRTKFDVGDLFTVNTVKYFADGSLSMIELYADTSLTHEPGTRDPLLWDEEHMMESMAVANREGFNIHTHAMTRKCVKADLTYERYKDVPAAMPRECISLKEALKAHTIHPAYQAHLENITGSIEAGKSAELVVLDSDIESISAEQIQDIKILETVFRGNTVYKANA